MRLTVNGESRELDVDEQVPLGYVLRNELNLKSVKLGCAMEQCGSCKVLVDGEPRYSCVTAAGAFSESHIETLEGFAGAELHPVQLALLEFNAAQCGYCLSGILVSARALFDTNPHPSRPRIRAALDDHLCRCGAQPRMLRALYELAER